MVDRAASFEPIRMLKALERHRVSFVVIGAFARVIHGADEVTAGLDITPSSRPENRRRLERALNELGVDSFPAAINEPTSLETDAGELKIVLEPDGTSGYDDLRRAASREPLGAGVRPSVASVGDLARMLAAHGVYPERLHALRRIAEIEQRLGRDL